MEGIIVTIIINHHYYSMNSSQHFQPLYENIVSDVCCAGFIPPFLSLHTNKSQTSQQKASYNHLCIYDAINMVACLELLIGR